MLAITAKLGGNLAKEKVQWDCRQSILLLNTYSGAERLYRVIMWLN